MSIRLMAQVWEIKVTRTQQSILLAMADHANDEGRHCYPSVPYLAWKTDYSERQVQRTLKELRDAGILEVTKEASRYQPTEYRIRLDRAQPKVPFRGDTDDTPAEIRGDTHVTPGVTPVSHRGDMGVVSGVTSMSPEPSIEPSVEPPREPRGGDRARTGRSPTPAAVPPPPANPPPVVLDYFDPDKLQNGRMPPGAGASPTEVYLESFSLEEMRRAKVQFDPTVKRKLEEEVKDLDKWRRAVAFWKLSGYKPGNWIGMLDRYHGNYSTSSRKGQRDGATSSTDPNPDQQLSPEEEREIREHFRRMATG